MKQLFTKAVNAVAEVCGIWMNETRALFKDEGMLLFALLLPLAYPVLYSWIYNNEVVHEVPVAVVDHSHSAMSREFIQRCDASPDVRVAYHCSDMEEARNLVGHQVVYGILYFPEDFAQRLNRMEQSTVGVYCHMGLMLTYKAIYQTATAVSSDMNANIQTALSGHYTAREEEIASRPLDFDEVAMFNSTGGYGNFILPGVLVLIIQQVLLLCLVLTGGTQHENGGFAQFRPTFERRLGTLRVVAGRSFCYLLIFAVMTAYILLAVPRMFHFVHILYIGDFLRFALPYLLACTFFAVTVSALVSKRENVMLLVVFTSVPLLFLSGISWPGSNIPEGWRLLSYVFPSTFGIQGFVKMNTTGALFTDILPEVRALWLQVAVYFTTACLVQRWQIRTALGREKK